MESFIKIDRVVLAYWRGHTDTQTDTHTDTQTDRQPGIFGPERSQYIQSMKMTECKNTVSISNVIFELYVTVLKV